jgi:hypothetical protein
MTRKTANCMLAGLAACALAVIWHATHGISMFAKVDLAADDGICTEADLRDAVSVVRKEFRGFDGCVMQSLRYSAEQTQQERDTLAQTGHSPLGDDFDEVIVLESDFTTSKAFSSIVYQGCAQQGFQWIVTRQNSGEWELKTAGYA